MWMDWPACQCFHRLGVQTAELQSMQQGWYCAATGRHGSSSSSFCLCCSAWACPLLAAILGCGKLQFGNSFSQLHLVTNKGFGECWVLGSFCCFYRRQRQFLQTLVPLAVGAKDGNSCKRLGLLVMQLFQASSWYALKWQQSTSLSRLPFVNGLQNKPYRLSRLSSLVFPNHDHFKNLEIHSNIFFQAIYFYFLPQTQKPCRIFWKSQMLDFFCSKWRRNIF